MYTIGAAAVGPDKDVKIDEAFVVNGSMAEVRPYVDGLIAGLAKRGRKLGSDFVIEYMERSPQDLHNGLAKAFAHADLLFPMSTSVLQATKKAYPTKPAVFPSISDPREDDPYDNATGVSAQRTQTTGQCSERFKATVPSLKTIYGLHKKEYGPARRALDHVASACGKSSVKYESVTVGSHQDIVDAINKIPARDLGRPAETGIQVLPDDLCLGNAATIIDLAHQKGIPVFFPVTDWVKPQLPSALGGFGIPQKVCGEMAAEFVDQILWGNKRPKDLPVKKGDAFEWVVSSAAAAALKMDVPAGIKSQGAHVI